MTKKITSTQLPAQARTQIAQLRQDITKARLDLTAGKLKNTRTVFNLRHQLARLLSRP